MSIRDYRDLQVADPDGLARWRADSERREAERAQADRDLRREERADKRIDAAGRLREEVGAEFAELRAELEASQAAQDETIGKVIGTVKRETVDRFDAKAEALDRALAVVRAEMDVRVTALAEKLDEAIAEIGRKGLGQLDALNDKLKELELTLEKGLAALHGRVDGALGSRGKQFRFANERAEDGTTSVRGVIEDLPSFLPRRTRALDS